MKRLKRWLLRLWCGVFVRHQKENVRHTFMELEFVRCTRCRRIVK